MDAIDVVTHVDVIVDVDVDIATEHGISFWLKFNSLKEVERVRGVKKILFDIKRWESPPPGGGNWLSSLIAK